MIVPFLGIKRQYQTLREELLAATDHVYTSGQVLDGEYTLKFEKEIARRCNRRHAISVGSGTQGLIFAIQATTPEGAAVLIPSVSFAATVNAPLQSLRRPVICDVDWKGLLDLDSMDQSLKHSGVSTIMYVNLYGNCLDYDRLRLYSEFFNDQLTVIEDAAQSFGASYKGMPSGKMGDISVLSFDPTKNLNNYGSGGMVLTDDFDLAETITNFKDNGKLSGHHLSGSNSKMSEADCAQMLVKLKYFDQWQHRRWEIANYYIEHLVDYVDVMLPNAGVVHAWHKFVIRTNRRSAAQYYLEQQGIETKIHYKDALHDLPLGYDFADRTRPFDGSENLVRECLSLPIYPEMTDTEVEYVAESVKEFFDRKVPAGSATQNLLL